jgi:hypothetical protein
MNPERDNYQDRLLTKLRTLRETTLNAWADATEHSLEVRKYVMHDPYTDKEKAAAAADNKPLLRYGLIVSKVQTIIGNEQANRREVKIMADSFENEDMVRLLSDNFSHIREREDLSRKLVRCLVNALLYKRGSFIFRDIEMDEFGYLTFTYRVVDSFMVHLDPNTCEADLSDCGYVLVDDWLTMDELKEKYRVHPLAEEDEREWWNNIEDNMSLENVREGDSEEYKQGDKYLLQKQYERRVVQATIVMIDGEFITLTDEQLKKKQKLGIPMEFVKKTTKKTIYMTTAAPYFDRVIFEDEEYPFETDTYPVFSMFTFDWYMPKNLQPSWAYLMLDVQDRVNKGKSQAVDYMIQKLGGSWHIAKREKEAIQALKESSGKPNAVIPYTTINNKAIRETGAADANSIAMVEQGVGSDMAFMNEISTVTNALEGKASNSAESGVSFDSKLEQSLVSTNPFYEMKAMIEELIVRDFCNLVPQVYFEDNRMIPVNMDGMSSGMRYEMINIQLQGKSVLDVRTAALRAVLDKGENTPNRLQRTFNENVAFAQMLLNNGFPPEKIPFYLIIKHSTIRDKADWQKYLQQGQEYMEQNAEEAKANAEVDQIMNLAGAMGPEAKAQ